MGACQARRRAGGRAAAAALGQPVQRTSLQEYCHQLQRREAGSVYSDTPAMQFPMFVVRVRDFLQMTEAHPHQALRSQGAAIEYLPSLGPATFISHQWCSLRHPDPCFVKLKVLQGVFQAAAQGLLRLQVDFFSMLTFGTRVSVRACELAHLSTGCLWYDYFSVPQPGAPLAGPHERSQLEQDLAKAVMSIPAYVDTCRGFFILAPTVPNADDPRQLLDLASWKSRGWCRLERIARVLSPGSTHMLQVTSGHTLVQVGAQSYLLDPVGEGAFRVDADREQLAPVLRALLSAKLRALLQAGDLYRYRRLLALRGAILRGLPGVDVDDACPSGFLPERSSDAVDAFLELYGFKSPVQRVDGTEPLLLAAMAGDGEVLQGLLARRASVGCLEGRSDPEFLIVKGASALNLACLLARQPSAVKVLLQHGAILNPAGPTKMLALSSASVSGDLATVEVLVAAAADLQRRDIFDWDALTTASMLGRHAVVARLLAARVEPAANRDGMTPLMATALFGAGLDTMSALLSVASCDMEARLAPRTASIRVLFAALAATHRLLGSTQQAALIGYHGWDATPLMVAAIMGNVAEGRALVEAGADIAARNRRNKTALQLAELAGMSPANRALLMAAADVN